MSFAAPAHLSLLAAPAAAVLLVLLRHRRRLLQQRRLASPAVWDRLLGGAPATGLARLLAWCVAAAFVVLALARPQWGEKPAEESVRTRDLVVAIDVSDSMRCPDLEPSRLARSLAVLGRALPGLEGNRVGVVVFAGDAYPLVPLTTDLQAAASFLAVVEPGMVALPGSNIERAVAAGLELLPSEGDGRVLVLITDGENLQGDPAAAAAALEAAEVGVLALVAGTEQGGPIPVAGDDGGVHYKRDQNGQPVVTRARRETLAGIADATGGEVVVLADGDPVRALVAAVDAIRTREVAVTQTVERIERFPIFLGAAALALAVGFALSPWRRRAAAAVATALLLAVAAGEVAAQAPLALPPGGAPPAAAAPAPAAPPVPPALPWWQRWLPGGVRRLARSGLSSWQAGDHPAAAEAFAGAASLDPTSAERLYDLGTALAANGQLDPALQVLARAGAAGAPAAAFNAGTAALGGGQAQAAVDWLRQAVVADPDDADAKRNLELALKLLEEQQQQEQQDEQQDQQDEQQDEQQQEQEGQATPTPQPTPSGGQGGPAPTPTPDPAKSIFAALERAEAEAREDMQSPTPQAAKVEKDW